MRICMLVVAGGTLLVALAYAEGRRGAGWAQVPYWGGQIISFVAVSVIVVSPASSRRDRLIAILAQAAQQSLVRWMYSPLFFSFPDELLHWRTAADILRLHHLFFANPTLPVSPEFPGLEEITTALVSLTHLDLFYAGQTVVATAHITLSAAIFFLARRMTQDDRIAGIAAVLYAANPHHASFNDEFIYEGPALLLLAVTLDCAVAARPRSPANFVAAGLCLAAVIVTHHVTAAVTIVFLAFFGLATGLQRRTVPVSRRLLGMAGLGVAAAGAWMAGVATAVFDYLAAPLATIIDDANPAAHARSKIPVAPAGTSSLLGSLVTVTGALVTLALVVTAVALAWRRGSRSTVPPLLRAACLGALSYFAILGIRAVVADGPDLATRLLTFVALLTSLAAAFVLTRPAVRRPAGRSLGPAVAVGVMLVIFLGGMTSGWPPQWELVPGRFRIAGFESGVDRQNTAAVRWFADHVGSDKRVACDLSTCSLLGAYAHAYPIGDASRVYYAASMTPAVIKLIQAQDIQYLFVDLRLATQTPITGQYFDNDALANRHTRPVPLAALRKFAADPQISLRYDSGTIQIYDLRRLNHAAQT